MDLRARDFGDYFQSIHGYRPFPWQQALVDRLAESDEWPDALNVPTGAGKTAALDAAVFHLALRADRPRAAALRIALVVDRRLVVDDAFARARKIADALERARGAGPQCEAAREVARRLQRLAGDGAPPLAAKRLRGGAPLEHDWARSPTQPILLCSTVDQVGSRLLFRGYGVSDRMKPVHAGLLGTDAVILLDEAHLSEPFRQTIESVREFGRASVKLVVMSATPAAGEGSHHALCDADRAHPLLRRRLAASKPAMLKAVSKNAPAAFAATARDMAARLEKRRTGGFAVGVVVNRVALAREIHGLLAKDEDERTEVLLMTGRSRSIDRLGTDDALMPFRTGENSREDARPLILVATQCLEVGVDLDLDGLVTQAAPLDALRQRFGRLNRDGRDSVAEGAILALSSDVAKRTPDPVYGDRIRLAWEALTRIAANDKVDFGVDALDADLARHAVDVSALAAPRDGAPALMPALLDLWSQTSPRPAADPEVSFFLHGAKAASDDVSIVWRNDIEPVMRDKERLAKIMGLVPPRAEEMLTIPLRAARNWLRDPQTAGAADASDINEEDPQDDEFSHRPGWGRIAYRWAGPDSAHTELVRAGEIRPGDILVVPAAFGGCDEFGWNPTESRPVADVADAAAEPFRGRRAHARVARGAVGDDSALWGRLSAILGDDGADETERVRRLLDALRSPTDTPLRADLAGPLEALLRAKGKRISVHFPYTGDPDGGAVFVAEQGLRPVGEETWDSAAPATEDESLSNASTKPVPLTDHGRHVEEFARRFAQTLELPPAIAADIRLSAFLHDAGKADRRFQTVLSGGSPWSLPETPLAKSRRPSVPDAWERAGLPPGWRHEALSVRMARVHPRFAEAHDPALVLWLIGVHHGFGRPFYRFVDAGSRSISPCLGVDQWSIEPGDAGPQSLSFEFDGMDWPELFRSLELRYGIWGLAHLEAVLRLADHRASESESRDES